MESESSSEHREIRAGEVVEYFHNQLVSPPHLPARTTLAAQEFCRYMGMSEIGAIDFSQGYTDRVLMALDVTMLSVPYPETMDAKVVLLNDVANLLDKCPAYPEGGRRVILASRKRMYNEVQSADMWGAEGLSDILDHLVKLEFELRRTLPKRSRYDIYSQKFENLFDVYKLAYCAEQHDRMTGIDSRYRVESVSDPLQKLTKHSEAIGSLVRHYA